MTKKSLLLPLLLLTILAACTPAPFPPSPTPTNTQVPAVVTTTPSATPLPTETPLPTSTQTLEPAATYSPTPTEPPTAAPTETPAVMPSPEKFRGKVNVDMASCRYGPGADYLFEYVLYKGNTMEVVGRNDQGTWMNIRAIGGTNSCWIKTTLLDLNGDPMSAQEINPDNFRLPDSVLYGPPASYSAVRAGDQVTVSWSPVWMTEDDDRGYMVEAWVCQGDKIVFVPDGTPNQTLTQVMIKDEAGCSEPSHARLYTVEKHGYTLYVNIPWPQAK